MALPGVSVGSVVKALQRVDRTDFGSLLSFIEMLEASLATEREKGRVLPSASLKVSEVFELFGFSNDFIDNGLGRHYQIPDMKLDTSTPGAHLESRDHELLKSISIVWPLANKSNVRLFVSMMIHFAIEQFNSETEAQSTEDSESLSVPRSSFPVILKAYTEAMVSWETTDSANKKVTVKGFIDYGISYAQKTPESLESFFTIVEINGADEMSDKSWAQLLAHMGMYKYILCMCNRASLIIGKGIIQKLRKKADKVNTTTYGLLTDGLSYEFSKISNGSKVFSISCSSHQT